MTYLLVALLLLAGVGVLIAGRKRAATVIATVLALPVLGVGLLAALFHGYSEEQPPPPPLTVANDSDDAIYLVRVSADVGDEEMHTDAYWNGSIAPGATSTTPLSEPNAVGEVCVRESTRTLVVESIRGERRYGSNYLDEEGVRQYPEPGAGDLRVLHEWHGGECFADPEPHFRWNGHQVVELAPPDDRRIDVPGWLAPQLVTVPFAIVLIVAGRRIDRRRAGPSVESG